MPSSYYETTKVILTGPKNFQLWMLHLLGALVKEKVLGVVTGMDLSSTTTTPGTSTPPQPETMSKNIWDNDWINDRLVLCLESEGLAPLAPATTSRKMYKKLVEIHCEVNVGINAFYNFVELIGLRWDGMSNVEEHVSCFSTINLKLTSLKKPIDNFFLAMLLLQSIPATPNWETFKSSVLNSLLSSTDLSFFGSSLRQKGSISNAKSSKSALKASKDKRQSKSQKQKNCKLHGTGNHSTKECFTLKQKNEREMKEKEKRKKKKRREKAHKVEVGLSD
ncbi:hypothetical protein K439DRAFT_1623071 [Ramaria rubella]|nr:hypothetical protein K439DRAFT_1623071 [Ramaria rubella]